MQRGGEPCAYDRVLSTRIGAGAAQAIMDEEYGVMIGVINGKIKRVPLAECAGKLKMVSPKDQLVKAAKQIGISFRRLMNYESSGRRGSLSAATVAKRRRVL